MTGIYFWALIVFVATLAALVWPVIRSREAGKEGQDEGLLILRDRLRVQFENVERDMSDDTMDKALAKKEINRIEQELIQVKDRLQSHSVEPEAGATSLRWPVSILAVALLSATVLYAAAFMQPITHEEIQAHNSSQQDPHAGMKGGLPPQVMKMVKQLEEKMKTEPDNLDGWKRLARSYQVMGNIQGAYMALERAYGLAPNDVDVVAHYAAVSYAIAQGNTEGKTAELFDKLLRLDPDNPSGLWFKGMAAFQKADYKQAISYWERTLEQIPAGDPGRQQVLKGIQEARKRQNAS